MDTRKKLKYIDIHAHVNFKVFDEDRDEVVKHALANNTFIINVGTQIDTSKKAVEMANKYDKGVYAIVGLHPIHTGASFHDEKELGKEGEEFTSRGETFDKDAYLKLLKDPKVVGIGECGLDYYRMTEASIKKQKKVFIEHIELAKKVNKPLMLHIRNNPKSVKLGKIKHNAYKDVLQILNEYPEVKGNVHFFAGTLKDAQAFVEIGFTISFTGVITFTEDYDEIIKNIPLDMIMTETDSPYVSPVPYRGKRNEPVYVREVVKRIAEIKGLFQHDVADAILVNAKRVFGI